MSSAASTQTGIASESARTNDRKALTFIPTNILLQRERIQATDNTQTKTDGLKIAYLGFDTPSPDENSPKQRNDEMKTYSRRNAFRRVQKDRFENISPYDSGQRRSSRRRRKRWASGALSSTGPLNSRISLLARDEIANLRRESSASKQRSCTAEAMLSESLAKISLSEEKLDCEDSEKENIFEGGEEESSTILEVGIDAGSPVAVKIRRVPLRALYAHGTTRVS